MRPNRSRAARAVAARSFDYLVCARRPDRRFPPPWSVENIGACFVVRDLIKIKVLFFQGGIGLRNERNGVVGVSRGRSEMTHPYAVTIAVLASLTVSVSPTRSDEYPTLNVAPICHGITDQSDLAEGLRKVSFDQCLQAEQVDRETMIKEWSTFSADDKRHCIALATTGGESSYTELLTCLEMARDVRELHRQASNSSAPVQQGPSAPPGHRQPTPR